MYTACNQPTDCKKQENCPTSVEPVKATLSTSMCLAIAAPADGPMPGKIFTTPSGKPTCKQKHINKSLRPYYSFVPLSFVSFHLLSCFCTLTDNSLLLTDSSTFRGHAPVFSFQIWDVMCIFDFQIHFHQTYDHYYNWLTEYRHTISKTYQHHCNWSLKDGSHW